MMKLSRFKVTNFRSVIDSGWIDCDDVTSLIGINEAGKSNVILALWKLKPVRDGEIDLLHDMPTRQYSSWRTNPEKIVFITAEFKLDSSLLDQIMPICGCDRNLISEVTIQRFYSKEYSVYFPNYTDSEYISSCRINNIMETAIEELEQLGEKTKSEAGIKSKTVEYYSAISKYVSSRDILDKSDFEEIKRMNPTGINPAASSEIYPHMQRLNKRIEEEFLILYNDNPSKNKEIQELILSEMPSFVYYSNYGNLDAQIYLPHAVKWLRGEEVIGVDNSSKVRTLRVLFDFVKLNPQEVLELGKDPTKYVIDQGREKTKPPTKEEIAKATEQKTARTILLNSASTELTRKFKEWWRQGNYIFRFQADGEFFKIWVSDDKRPEEIELERRSTGLQWFLSFYLVFLVESQEAHKGAILLLDEAGLSLHPLAQKDLIAFFNNLSQTNQIIYTTHSPFLVDTSNIDRAKVVYSDDNGLTVVSGDLRASDDKLNEKSIYAVHAALGLSVSDILLQGCQSIVVEGPSDQYYLNAIKLFLIKHQKYAPNKELIFIPSGGIKGVSGIVSIVGGKNGDLPLVIMDSDQSGETAMAKLKSGLYQHQQDAIIGIGQFVELENAEVEDLIPPPILSPLIDRLFRDVEDEMIEHFLDNRKPIIPQIENFAHRHNITLAKGWKVEIAKGTKQKLQKLGIDDVPTEYVEKWLQLFSNFNRE